MSMKKIAFYVEGQTEMLFMEKLIIEIAGQKNIQIEFQQFQGKKKPIKYISIKTTISTQNPQYYILIYDCMGDGSVKSRMLEDANSLFLQNYTEIIGLIDLFPNFSLADLAKLEKYIIGGIQENGKTTPSLPAKTSIVIAVREIEDWFLAECNHYFHIDNLLNDILISTSELKFNPWTDDLTIRKGSASKDLNAVYKLVGKDYNKHLETTSKTINCLDYANLYLNIRAKIPKLDELITKIDTFLT